MGDVTKLIKSSSSQLSEVNNVPGNNPAFFIKYETIITARTVRYTTKLTKQWRPDNQSQAPLFLI